MSTFVPADFTLPDGLDHEEFRLRPLGPDWIARDWPFNSIEYARRDQPER